MFKDTIMIDNNGNSIQFPIYHSNPIFDFTTLLGPITVSGDIYARIIAKNKYGKTVTQTVSFPYIYEGPDKLVMGHNVNYNFSTDTVTLKLPKFASVPSNNNSGDIDISSYLVLKRTVTGLYDISGDYYYDISNYTWGNSSGIIVEQYELIPSEYQVDFSDNYLVDISGLPFNPNIEYYSIRLLPKTINGDYGGMIESKVYVPENNIYSNVTNIVGTPGNESVALTWTDGSNNVVTHVNVHQSLGGNAISDFIQHNPLIDASENYTVTGLTNGINYRFILFSQQNGGNDVYQSFTETSTYTPTGSIIIPPGPGGGGDPHIRTIDGEIYDLPHIDGRFLMFDNKNPNEHFRIEFDAKRLSTKEVNTSKFKNHFVEDTTFITKFFITFMNEQIEVDMNTLNIKQSSELDNISCSPIYEDKDVLRKYYNELKIRKYKINFDGKSRDITFKGSKVNYKLKLSLDLNCADHRNDMTLTGTDLKSGIGALISSKFDSLLYKY
jgi:hypothetical protein